MCRGARLRDAGIGIALALEMTLHPDTLPFVHSATAQSSDEVTAPKEAIGARMLASLDDADAEARDDGSAALARSANFDLLLPGVSSRDDSTPSELVDDGAAPASSDGPETTPDGPETTTSSITVEVEAAAPAEESAEKADGPSETAASESSEDAANGPRLSAVKWLDVESASLRI